MMNHYFRHKIKSITGNLDASDMGYYSNYINKISHDEHLFEEFMKNFLYRISV